ncbi:MAG: HD domain-containing phosphohydrolase [Candidatus Omnitrophota bacterium]|jgi:putative nucleotidyltransferase with HDIG domain
MLLRIEEAIKDLMSAIQMSRLYPDWHPQFKKGIEKSYLSLNQALSQQEEIVIGIIGEEFAFGNEIFFNLSKRSKPMIQYLKGKGIERIVFYRGLKEEELSGFVSFLAAFKDEIKPDLQKEFTARNIKNIAAGKIKAGGALSEDITKAVDYFSLYDDSLKKFTKSIDSVINAEELDHVSFQLSVQSVMDNLLGKYQELLNFAAVQRYDVKTFSHILNVSILSMYFSGRLGFNKEAVREIGSAALFHDIGKIYISRKIIRKSGKLTEQEFDKIKNHVILGAELMLEYVDSLGMLPVVVAYEHHLKYDRSGYPKPAFPCKMHVASLIVSICDVYDALSSRRSYKADYPPQVIYEIMLKDKGKAFEPVLLDKFFSLIGVWPIGSKVILNDGRVVLVKEENEDDIFSPRVEVKDSGEILDLKALKNTLKIERYINPYTESEKKGQN